MKRNFAIIIVLVLIILGAVGLWFCFGRGGGGGGGEGAGEGGGEEQGFIGKIADALKIGTAMKCTYSEGDTTAAFYIKGGKLRGSTGTGDDKVDYIIRDDCMYYWGMEENQGVKICWEPAEVPDWEEYMTSAAAAQQYNCQPQTISDSMFSLPSGINFMDMSEYMQQYMEE